MKTNAIQGMDGSPQPSADSYTIRASRQPALAISPLRASAPPREFSLCPPLSAHRSRLAFTLLEVLVATAILAMMLAFLFNLVGSSAKLWEVGNKKMEAAQAARVGLNIMARDLKNAFAGNMTTYTSNGTAINNIAPFMAFGNNTTTTMGLGGGAISANGSQQIAGVTLTNNSSIPYNEFGYMAVFIDDADGIDPMIGDRYYLVKKADGVTTTGGDFYIRGNATAAWHSSASEFYPIIDHCIRLKLGYYGNSTSSTGTPGWTTTWSPVDRLPLGVLVTISVIDSKTAVKINAIKNGSALTELEITNGLSSSPSATLTDIERLISQGSVTMSRFIPFNSN
jgi:prepilin-type N-terminal cleavage/methylation domain-containing protein